VIEVFNKSERYENMGNQNINFIDPVFRSDDPVEILTAIKKLNLQSKSQLRKFFDEIKKDLPETEIKKHVVRLTLLIEYSKNRNVIDQEFYKCMTQCLEYLMKNPTKQNYEKFYEFLEGIVAFHSEKKG
jgi:CRISPR type III-A-associated protein Csm2